jgi:hypothetical protein
LIDRIERVIINLDSKVVTYMDSMCGGYSGRSAFIKGLIYQYAAQNPVPPQQYTEPVISYPEPELYNNTPILHRRQKGFVQPNGVIFKRRSRI